jgi:hypothetical protein
MFSFSILQLILQYYSPYVMKVQEMFSSSNVQFTSNEHFVEDTGFWEFVMLCHWFRQSKNNYSSTS